MPLGTSGDCSGKQSSTELQERLSLCWFGQHLKEEKIHVEKKINS
jgi:hypothetical protein